MRGIHRWPVKSPHKWQVTWENVFIWWRHHVVIFGDLWWGRLANFYWNLTYLYIIIHFQEAKISENLTEDYWFNKYVATYVMSKLCLFRYFRCITLYNNQWPLLKVMKIYHRLYLQILSWNDLWNWGILIEGNTFWNVACEMMVTCLGLIILTFKTAHKMAHILRTTVFKYIILNTMIVLWPKYCSYSSGSSQQ